MSAMDPTMRIGPQVEVCLRVHTDLPPGKRRELALQALRDVDLPEAEEVYRKYPHELSGGMLQRAMIAAAILPRPKLLLADEPVASLDPVTGRQILELLRDIQQDQKLTVLMNSHNLELSQEFSSRLIGLNQGTVVLDAPADTPAEDILAAVYHRQEDQSWPVPPESAGCGRWHFSFFCWLLHGSPTAPPPCSGRGGAI